MRGLELAEAVPGWAVCRVDSVNRVPPVRHEQCGVDGVDVDGAIEMAAAGGVEGEIQRKVVAKVTLDAEGDLLDVWGVVVEVGGQAGWEDSQGEAGWRGSSG